MKPVVPFRLERFGHETVSGIDHHESPLGQVGIDLIRGSCVMGAAVDGVPRHQIAEDLGGGLPELSEGLTQTR
jgi:hypothetical protein